MSQFEEWSDIDMSFTKNPDGSVKTVVGEDAIHQSIKLLLSTMIGERVRSSIGSTLYLKLFDPMSEDSADEMKSIISTNIDRYIERVILMAVSITPHFDDHYYELAIEYRIPPSKSKKVFRTYMPALGEL